MYYQNEIIVRKFKELNKKDYYVINLYKLWNRLFPKQNGKTASKTVLP